MRKRYLRLGLVALAAVATAAGLWWLYTDQAGFPLGFHMDESKKLRFALTQEQDFHHPILMIQAMRIARELLGIESFADMLVVGRNLSAFYTLLAVGLVVPVYLKLLRTGWALAAACALAVTPLLAVHAHYVKEDAVFLATIVPALWALIRFAEVPDRGRRALVLGLTMGLALAAQYKAALFVGLAWLLPLMGSAPRTGVYWAGLRRATALAVVVFLVVCYPLLLPSSTFGGGFANQVGHVLSGHYVKIYAIPELFTYHLRQSLLPGLTPPLAVLGVAGTVWAVASWRRLDTAWRIAILYLGVFYVSAELSPSKPPPDFMRYMMPAAPIVVAVAFRLLQEASSLGARWAGLAAMVVSGTVLAASVEHVTTMEDDTRYAAQDVVSDLEREGARVLVETYSSPTGTAVGHSQITDAADMRAQGYTHLSLSSFGADRYLEGAEMPYQRREVYEGGERMRGLLARPHVEISSEAGSFAYQDPTIWIIDLRESADTGADR